MLKRSGNSTGMKVCGLFRERTAQPIVPGAEIRSRFPQLGKEFFVERCLQIAYSGRTAGATLGAHHAFNHFDVMRSPQRKEFVVFEQRFSQLIFLVQLLRMGEDFDNGALSLAVIAAALLRITWRIEGRRVKPRTTQERKE